VLINGLDHVFVAIPMVVIVVVDATSEELHQAVRKSRDLRTLRDVVRAEIESHLESLSYVRHVSIT
jgi:hypothetical protein